MRYKSLKGIFCICMLLLSMSLCTTGCAVKLKGKPASGKKTENAKQEQQEDTKEKSSKAKTEEKGQEQNDEEDDVIIAGSVDTESKFSFSVEEALIGISDLDEPIVVLVGSFVNNSEETISFSYALETTALQNGYTLPTAYLSGTSEFNYNDIAPGNTIPVFIGWKIADGEHDITLTVIDRQHYAKKEIYSQTFTIDELIKNTENYQDSEGILEEPL